jgi:uncharacterized protein
VRRAVVDTNVWVSGLLKPSGWPGRIRRGLEAGRFALVTSEPLLSELSKVLSRPRIIRRFGVHPTDTAALLSLIRERAEIVTITRTVALCRDPDDDIVLETAMVGHADTVVTRDDDLKGDSGLLEALVAHGIEVLTVRRFLEAIEGESPLEAVDSPDSPS